MALGKMCTRFLSMASHDLRNSLAIIRSGLDMLAEYYDRMSEEKREGKFGQIRASIHHMVELLDDILIIGRFEAHKLKFKPESLALVPFCTAILADMRVAIGEQHTIMFTPRGRYASVMINSKLLRHIIVTLISNAVKYSLPGSTVRFELQCDHATHIVLRVKDEGIGD
jgi:signal transduction histidine kinase